MGSGVPRARALATGWHGTHTALLMVAWGAAIGAGIHVLSRAGAWSALHTAQTHLAHDAYDASRTALMWFEVFETLGSLAFFATTAAIAGGFGWYARLPRASGARPLAWIAATAASIAVVDELALHTAHWIDPEWAINAREVLRYFWLAPAPLLGVAIACGLAAMDRGTRFAGGRLPRALVAACAACAAVSFGWPVIRFFAASEWTWPFEHPVEYSLLLAPWELGVGGALLALAGHHRRATRPNRSGDERDWRRWLGWASAARGLRTFTRGLAASVIVSIVGLISLFVVAMFGDRILVEHTVVAMAVGALGALLVMVVGLTRFCLVPARAGARHLGVAAAILVAIGAAQALFVAAHVARINLGDRVLDATQIQLMHHVDIVGRIAHLAATLVVLAALHRVTTTIDARHIARRIRALAPIVLISHGALAYNQLDADAMYGGSLRITLGFGVMALCATLVYIGIARETAYTIEGSLAER